jgi:RHS repeat-associated protein
MTGEVFTIPKTDLSLPGFFGVRFDRRYSTQQRTRDDGLGWGWTHNFAWAFHVHGRTIRIRDGHGHAVEFPVLDESGYQSSAGGWGLLRAGKGYLLRAGNRFHHVFLPDPKDDAVFRLAEIRYGARGRVGLAYEDGRLARMIDTAGRQIIFTGDGYGRIASISVPDPGGRAIVFARYQYDHGGHLVAATDADGATWRYRYDDDRRLIDMRLPTDLTYHYRYDRKGRCVETWGDYLAGVADRALADRVPALLADGRTKAKGIHHAKLDFANGYSEVTDSVRILRVFGRPDGKVTKAVNGMGGVTTRTLDQHGNEVEREDPNGAVTRWTHDAMGNVLSETDAMGGTTKVVRDFEGFVIETTDAAGGKILTPRDLNGNILMFQDQNGATKTFRYTPRGLPSEEIDARGARTAYEWDTHGNLIGRTLANGAQVRFAYDYWGRCVREDMPNGNVLRFGYSDSGRMTRVQDSLGRTKLYEYDGFGEVTAVTTPDGQTTRYEYGGLGWLANVTYPNGDQLQWRYNREGWLCSLANEKGELWEFVQDRAGRLVEERMFNGAFRRYKLDLTGFVVEMEDASGITKFERNVLGQIVSRVAPDETELALTYNALGQVVSSSLPGVKVEFDLDPTGALIREQQTIGDQTYEVASVRDPGALRTALKTSVGLELRIVRDALGDVSELGDQTGTLVKFERAANGNALWRHFPQGGAIVDTYDASSRLVRRQVVRRGSKVVAGEEEPVWIGGAPPGTVYKAYGYSPIDEITSVSTATDGTTEFEYDLRRHVVMRRRGASEETWAADAVANYYERDAGQTTRSYLPGGRIALKGSTEYVWDDRGYLTEKRCSRVDGGTERWRYHWNGSNLLGAVDLPDGRRVDYDYDAYARRVAKRVSRQDPAGERDLLSTTHYVWDRSSLLHEIEVGGGQGASPRTYLFEESNDATPIAQRDDGRDWIHYVGDVNGTPDELVDAAGNLMGGLRRSTFGAASPTPGSTITTPFRSPGQIADDDVGLHYNRYRYYDPETGHYISPDPIGVDGGTNLYMFGPNPIAWFDLLGWQHQLTSDVYGPDGNALPVPWNRPTGNTDGNYASGARPWPDPAPANAQAPSVHTERQFLRDAERYQRQNGPDSLNGAQANLHGQYPPCPQCHKAMRQFADQSGMHINYSWPGPPPSNAPQSIQYTPGIPPQGTGAGGRALVGTGSANSQGAYAMSPTGNPNAPYSWDNHGTPGTNDTSTALGQYGAQKGDIQTGPSASPTHDDGTPWQPPPRPQ